MSLGVNFTSFIRLNGVQSKLNPDRTNFSGQIEMKDLELGLNKIPYDLSLRCTKGLRPEQFSLCSNLNTVLLTPNDKGFPEKFILTNRTLDGKFKFKVEFQLDINGDPRSLKFYLPPNNTPVNREEDLTDIRQTKNCLLDPTQEIAGEQEVQEILFENPFFEEAYNAAELHLNLSLHTFNSSLRRAREISQ